MAPRRGFWWCVWGLPLAAAFCGEPALVACGSRAFRASDASNDGGIDANGEGVLPLDAGSQETGVWDSPRGESPPNVTDVSSSPCPAATGLYGACERVLGWGFDGKVCRQWAGCDCSPDCSRLFPTAYACAQACQVRGGCNLESPVGKGIARFAVGGSCDSLVACLPAEPVVELGLDLAGVCRVDGICAEAQTCPITVPDAIDQAQWGRYCTASLIVGVRIECFQRIL